MLPRPSRLTAPCSSSIRPTRPKSISASPACFIAGAIRPPAGTWRAYFQQLHVLYPHALLGFGEIGMNNPATPTTLSAARSLIRHYYGLALKLPYYVGGYFWWYFKEDGLPYTSQPLWGALRDGFRAEARTRTRGR